MTTTALVTTIAITAGGLVLSIFTSAFIAGSRWGQVRSEIDSLKANAVTKDEFHSVKETLAEIKGMFQLKLKE